MKHFMNKGISILICTYNGALRLPETLRHIAAQQLPAGIACEVIVVDNASTDNTLEAIDREWQTYTGTIKMQIMQEIQAGLTYARHRGIMEAHYEYVILCDDDNWLAHDYVEKAFHLMEQHTNIGMLGGQGYFVFETPAPAWLLACNLYAGGPQATQSGPMKDHCVYGAGAVLRKPAYEWVCRNGFTSALTDRQGHVLSSGGDYELCYVLALAGYTIWYESSLCFHHFITANRLTLSYYLTYIEESSHCFSVLEPYKILLKTNNASLTSFRWELFKSFWYHLKKLCILFFGTIFTSRRSRSAVLHTIQVSILRQRLLSYRDVSMMKNNFIKVSTLQPNLLQSK
jgi:glycosyltransferase involved in cell wall biosynthesis